MPNDTKALIASIEKEMQREAKTAEDNAALMRLQEIAKAYSGDDEVISSAELVEAMLKLPKKEKFYSGFPLLDKYMEGFMTGESIFVSGITKHGKTSMMMELCVRFEKQNPLWLSFEEKPIELIRKFHEKTGIIPHFYTPRRDEKKNLEWVERKIIEAKAKFGTKVVFLDHIGFVKDHEMRPGENEANCYERISRSIHSLAGKWDVVFFHLGHLTKVGITQNPDIENIKGSSAMAQEADLTMLVWRKTVRENGKVVISNETNLSLQANRRGQTGNVEFFYSNGRFEELDFDSLASREEEDDTDWGITPSKQ